MKRRYLKEKSLLLLASFLVIIGCESSFDVKSKSEAELIVVGIVEELGMEPPFGRGVFATYRLVHVRVLDVIKGVASRPIVRIAVSVDQNPVFGLLKQKKVMVFAHSWKGFEREGILKGEVFEYSQLDYWRLKRSIARGLTSKGH